MSERETVVLDASVGVKWFKNEPGSAEARALLEDHRVGLRRIVVPSLFKCEVAGVAARRDVELGPRVWGLMRDADLTVVGLDDDLADAAFDQCRLLGCSFYDALAPALAAYLGVTLCSADSRSHSRFPGVALFG